jgi:polysaccharide pyruvyl transferase WcaK-like protein
VTCTGTAPGAIRASAGAARGEPRILIENSEYWLLNMGDLAMLDVTVTRFRARWPGARIGVMTDAPELLRAYFPGVDPIVPWGSSVWSAAGPLARSLEALGPRVAGPYDIARVTAEAWLRRKARGARREADRLLRSASPHLWPGRSARVPDGDGGVTAAGAAGARLAPNTALAVASSSLVVGLGGGYLTDADPVQTARAFDLFEHASSRGLPTALLGQGIGPIEDPAVLSRAAEVLPHVDVIALREGRRGPALLERTGVPSSRVLVTGDDAIELAYSQRPDGLGHDLGVCLRVADYSPVSAEARATVAACLRSLADELRSDLVPVIISAVHSEDRRSTLPLVRGSGRARPPLHRFPRPQDVAAQVGGCRVMVTGAYHAAVFALSQGVPVVALTSSSYYDDKFLGLAGMFGTGLELIRLDGDDLAERLPEAVRSAWAGAPGSRSALLTRAAEQIELSRAAFQRVCDLV